MKNRSIGLVMLLLSACFTLNAQDFAVRLLENSTRHQEWVDVKSGNRKIHCFIVYPEKSVKVPVIIVIHENRGLTDWVRSMADQLAAAGYIAIAPDLLSGFSANFERTSDFANSDEARNAIYQLNQDQVTKDLLEVQEYVHQIEASNGKLAVVGFCWGGSQSFRFATNSSELNAALVFYGSSPKDFNEIIRISAPVYGFYGGNDERINAGIPETEKLMKEADKEYEYVIYPGAGHAYMRMGDDPNGSKENKEARNKSWERMKQILSNL